MMIRCSRVRRGHSLVRSQELNTAALQVPLERKGSAKSGPMRGAISEGRGLLCPDVRPYRCYLRHDGESWQRDYASEMRIWNPGRRSSLDHFHR